MAGILTAVLQQCSGEAKHAGLGPLSAYASCVVLGDGDSPGKSLLFLAALTAASELGLAVLFLRPAPIESLPAELQGALARLSPDRLEKIKFKYPRCLAELRYEVASLHEVTAAPPSLVIVDGLELYLGSGADGGLLAKQTDAAHMSALLLDTAAFLTQKLGERGAGVAPCQVIASFRPEQEGRGAGDPPAPDPVLAAVERYFPVRCTLTQGETSSSVESATGMKETWHIYFSGAGLSTTLPLTKTGDPTFGQQWSLSVSGDGVMESSVLRVNH